jgi:hypothetical protein
MTPDLPVQQQSTQEHNAKRSAARPQPESPEALPSSRRIASRRSGPLGGRTHPRTDCRDHAIPQARHGCDISGLLGVIAENAPQRGHSLIHGIGTDSDSGPDLRQQFVDADHFARMLGQAQQQPHRARVQPRALSIAWNLAGSRIDAPGADPQHRRGRAFHAPSFRAIQNVSDQLQDFPGFPMSR